MHSVIIYKTPVVYKKFCQTWRRQMVKEPFQLIVFGHAQIIQVRAGCNGESCICHINATTILTENFWSP